MTRDPSTTAVTVAMRPGAASPTALTRTPVTLATPEDVLYQGELERGRLWVTVCLALSLGGLFAAAAFVDAAPAARAWLAGGCGFLLVVSLIGRRVLARERGYSAVLAALYGHASLLALLPALHFFGWSSAIVLLVALGGVIFAMGHTTRAVLTMTATVVAAHGTLGALTIAGVLPDRGLVALRVGGTGAQVLCLFGCEVLFVLSFVIGRQLRRHAHAGVDSYGRAMREGARREALLDEARAELERARQIGGPGRYTGLALGDWELGAVLGRGGMGEVYEGVHRETRALAAVKVMGVAGGINERSRERFEREIALLARVDSPHVVRVLGHSEPGAEVHYLVMERLAGVALSDELRSLQRGSRATALAMLRQIGRGVDAAHAAGVVHRDLTPRNLFHHTGGGQDVWKVLDFGVSRLDGAGQTLTGGALVGTPNYMSPEQAQGGDVDARSDLFSLASVAYRCLTGRPAFTGTEIATVLYRVVHDMPLRPSLIAGLPESVDDVLAIAFAKDRDQRFATASELVTALEEACDGKLAEALARRAAALSAAQPWKESLG